MGAGPTFLSFLKENLQKLRLIKKKHRKVVVLEYPPITLCYWEQKCYEMGVVEADVAGHKLRIYDIERSVCDVVRFRNKVGMDVMTEVLRAYLRKIKYKKELSFS